jgi:branched-chain amino acid transport system substrate-binding protein
MPSTPRAASGQKIELVSLDDKFDPKLAAENARKLIEEQNVLAMFLTRGTPHTEAIIPLLDKNGVPLIGPSTGAMVLHQPVRSMCSMCAPPYQREAEKAVTHLTLHGHVACRHRVCRRQFWRRWCVGAQKGMATPSCSPLCSKNSTAPNPTSRRLPQGHQSNAQAVIMVAASQAVVDGVKAFRAAGSTAQDRHPVQQRVKRLCQTPG